MHIKRSRHRPVHPPAPTNHLNQFVIADRSPQQLCPFNDLTVGIMALVAQQEREAISRRTKEALAAAKARGVKLGNPNGAAALRRAGEGGLALRAAVSRNADEFAAGLAEVVAAIRAEGHVSLRAIAAQLNARGILTRREGRWQVSNVRGLVLRLATSRKT
ncbi:recombinase family protein [Vannielia litorea]|uniref:recombinase family protein n=1 Tax=Vannielia litorea TaxID=1217970 RepID=UPI001BCC16A4|nr:recombinase family protein [Vannielia litorea]MBS8228423.1 resolvase [Vannielia litorea]